MPGNEKPRSEKYAEYRRALDYSVVGLVFPVAMILGWFLGRTVGFWFGRPELGGLVGGGLGIVAAFYNVVVTVQKLNREDRQDKGSGDSS